MSVWKLSLILLHTPMPLSTMYSTPTAIIHTKNSTTEITPEILNVVHGSMLRSCMPARTGPAAACVFTPAARAGVPPTVCRFDGAASPAGAGSAFSAGADAGSGVAEACAGIGDVGAAAGAT